MKYEITHDNIAYHVFRKTSETQHRRLRVKKLVEERCKFRNDAIANQPDAPPPVLSRAELAHIDDYFQEIHFTDEEIAYIDFSKEALRQAANEEQRRLEKQRQLQRRISITTALFAFVAAIAAVVFAYFYSTTEARRKTAKASYMQGLSAKAYASGNVTDAYRFAAEAVDLSPDSASNWNALYNAVYQPGKDPFFLYFRNVADLVKTDLVENVVFGKNDSLMLLQYNTGEFEIIDMYRVKRRFSLKDTFNFSPKGADFDATGTRFLTYDNKNIHIYKIADQNVVLEKKISLQNTVFDVKFNPRNNDSIDIAGNYFLASCAFQKTDKLDYYIKIAATADDDILKMEWNNNNTFAVAQTLKNGIQVFKKAHCSNGIYAVYDKKYLNATFLNTKPDEPVQLILQGQNYLERDELESNAPRTRFTTPWTDYMKTAALNRNIVITGDYFSIEDGDYTAVFSLHDCTAKPILVETQTKALFNYSYELKKAIRFGEQTSDLPQFSVYDLSNNNTEEAPNSANGSGHRKSIKWAFFNKHQQIVSIGADGFVKMWNLTMPAVTPLDNKTQTVAAKFDYTGDYILTKSARDSVYLWHKGALKQWHFGTKNADFTPDNLHIFCMENKGIHLFALDSVDDKKAKGKFVAIAKNNLKWFSLAINRKNILLTDEKNILYIADGNGNVQQTFDKWQEPVDSAKMSFDGKKMVVFGKQKTWLTDAEGKQLGSIQSFKPLLCAKFSADSRYVLLVTKPDENTHETRKTVFDTETNKIIWEQKPPESNDFKGDPNAYNFDNNTNYLTVMQNTRYQTYEFKNPKSAETPIEKAELIAYAPQTRYCVKIIGNSLQSHRINYAKRRILNGKTDDVNRDDISDIIFSSKGDYFLLNNTSLKVFMLFDSQANYLAEIEPIASNEYSPSSLRSVSEYHAAVSRNDRYLLTYEQNGLAKLWNLSVESIRQAMKKARVEPIQDAVP